MIIAVGKLFNLSAEIWRGFIRGILQVVLSTFFNFQVISEKTLCSWQLLAI